MQPPRPMRGPGWGMKARLHLINSGTLSLSGTANILYISGDWSNNGTFTPGTAGTVNFTGSGQAITDASGTNTFRNVTFSGSGTTTLSSPIHANGAFTISSGTLATGDFDVTFGGNFTNSGTFSAGGSLITITGTTAQSIAGFTTTGIILMSKTGNIATLGGNVNSHGLTINGSGGTLNLGLAFTHTIAGNWTRTSGTLDGNTSTLIIGG